MRWILRQIDRLAQAWLLRRARLLDYTQADTFTRATEAAFVDLRGWRWVGPGELRVFPSGAVLVEGVGTNQIMNSEDFVSWTGWVCGDSDE